MYPLSDEGKKLWYVYTAIKNEEILRILLTCLDLESTELGEINQTE